MLCVYLYGVVFIKQDYRNVLYLLHVLYSFIQRPVHVNSFTLLLGIDCPYKDTCGAHLESDWTRTPQTVARDTSSDESTWAELKCCTKFVLCVFIKAFEANLSFFFFWYGGFKRCVFHFFSLVFICLHLKYSIYQHLVNSRLVKGAFINPVGCTSVL